MKKVPAVPVTFSGIVTDLDAHALNADNQPGKGLYAAGEAASPGLFGTEPPGWGTAICAGAYSGRAAGANTAKGL